MLRDGVEQGGNGNSQDYDNTKVDPCQKGLCRVVG